MINPITRFVDLTDFADEIRAGRGLKVVVHGPQREYIQVLVCDRKDMVLPQAPGYPVEPTAEPEVKEGE